jgi:hypothetical protein
VKVMVTQPIYLGWIGHFAQIDAVDLFLFLDDTALERSSRKRDPWQTANRIKGQAGPVWLRVPTFRDKEKPINQVGIDYGTDWPRKHMESLRQCYAKGRYSSDCLDIVRANLEARPEILADLTVKLTTDLARNLGIKTEMRRTSELGIDGKRTDRLKAILKAVGATEYLANPGSRAYMGERPDLGCKVTWFDYTHPVYPQMRGDFIPYMSIVDLMMNCGARSLEILREGVPCKSVDSPSGLVAVSS